MKLTQEEIQELHSVRSQTDEIVIKLGELSFQKINLDLEEKAITNKLIELNNLKDKISQDLFKKYGKINISIETGEYSLIESK